MAELGDEDDFPNDFDGFDFDSIPALQVPTVRDCTPEIANPPALPRDSVPSTAASPISPTGSDSTENLDSSFLAAVDALEARALGEMARGSGSSSCAEHDGHPTNRGTLSLERVRESLASDDKRLFFSRCVYGVTASVLLTHLGLSTASRKGKRKIGPHEDQDLRTTLEGYEADLTCPICFDLLVGAQVTNPCGHTCCGACSYGWLARNYEATCAVCRSKLSSRRPFLSNFTVDNLVRQHIQALAKSGRPEWQENGYKIVEWNTRLQSWKEQAAGRVATEKSSKETRRRRRTRARHNGTEDHLRAAAWAVDESTEDGEFEHTTPRRGTRSRH